MKVHIISENPSDAEFAEQALSFEGVIAPTDSELSAEEGEVVVFDYSLGKNKILAAIKSNPGPIYFVFYDELKSKEQRDLESADPAPHALLKRPANEDFFMDIISDFMTDIETVGDRTKTNPEFGELTFIGQKKNKTSVAAAIADFDGPDEDNSAQPMQEFKMSGEIKDIIKKHTLSPERTPDFNSQLNQNIQKKFDIVFPDAAIPSVENQGNPFRPIDEELLRGISEDIKPIEGVSLNLDGALEDLTAEESGDELTGDSGNVTMTVSEENIQIPQEIFQSVKAVPAHKPEDSMTEKKTDPKEDASLMFDLGSDLDKELVGDSQPSKKTGSTAAQAKIEDEEIGEGDLSFSVDSNASESAALPGADGLELGNDESEHTTVFKGKSVELGGISLPDGDDLVLDSVSNDTTAASAIEESVAGEGIEFDGPVSPTPAANTAKDKKPDKKSDEIDLDLDMDLNLDEGPTKVGAEESVEEPVQEFDYKTAAKSSAKIMKEEDDLDIDMDDDLDLKADLQSSTDIEEGLSVDEDLEAENEEEDDAPTRILTANKRTEATSKKSVEVIDISEGEDDGPIIIGSEKIPTASLNENDLVRLQATIRHLKGERENLLKEVESLKEQKREMAQENVGLRAEIDDLKIEISIIRKRHEKDFDNTKEQLHLHEERKSMYEEKLKQYQKEIERLNHKLRVDFTKVKQREKELESQLELQAMDSENQIKSRDKKILDLKRKIDSLEFNMENSSIREQKFREDKDKIEERMNKIIHTLRNSINVLEDDLDLDEETLEKIKKA